MTEQATAQPLDGAALLDALGVTDPVGDEALAPEDDEGDGVVAEPDVVAGVIGAPPEFVCPRSVLVGMVEQVMLAVPSKDFYPALKSILVEVTDSTLTLTGSNSVTSVISRSLAVQTARPGQMLVSGSKFAAIVRLAAGRDIRVVASPSSVSVSSGGRSWTLRPPSTQEYPPLAQFEDLAWVEVERAAYDHAVAGTRYAAGTDIKEDQYMQVVFSGGNAVATDRRRFAQVSAGLPPDLSVSVATAGVDLISKLLSHNDADQFRVADTPRHTVVEIGPVEAPDRAVIGHLARGLPAEDRNALAGPLAANRERCVVVGTELLDALAAARPTQDSESGVVLLRVAPEELTVESRNRYGDSSVESIGCTYHAVGTDRAPKPRTISVVRDHLARAVRAAQRATTGVEDPEEEDLPAGVEVELLLGEDRSRSRLAPVLVRDVPRGTTQAVLVQVRSEWLT